MPTLSLTQTIQRQLELFNRIYNSSANIKKVGKDNITHQLLETKLQILKKKKNWKKFQEDHTIVLSQKFESSSKSDYFVNNCYGVTENGYINSTVYIAQSLKQFPQKDNVPIVQQPTFSGKFTDQLDSKDLFKATIFQNERLSNSEILQQLKTHVQGEAADMLKTIQVTDLNFPIVWKTTILTDDDSLLFTLKRYSIYLLSTMPHPINYSTNLTQLPTQSPPQSNLRDQPTNGMTILCLLLLANSTKKSYAHGKHKSARQPTLPLLLSLVNSSLNALIYQKLSQCLS